MGNVSKNEFSKGRDKITQDDLKGGDFTIATIVKFERIPVDYGKDGKRPVPALLTEEFGDKVLWLNATQVGYLIDRLGDETDDWVGQRVPLVKTIASFGDDRFPKVTVAVPEEWDDLLAMAPGTTGAPARRMRTAAPALAPAKKKRGR